MRDPLPRRWTELCRAAGATDEDAIGALLADILERYAEPQRHYHTAEHVLEVLQTIAALGDPALPAVDTQLAGPGAYHAVCFAGWLHDVIYDPRSGTNEEDSAVYAVERLGALGLAAGLTDEVGRLIRLTQQHEVADDDLNGMVLMDADLAILSARRKRYDRYAEAIRAEYQHVDDESYRAGRAAVLRTFLDRGSLYSTQLMVTRCDEAARANLRRELASLTA